MAKSNGSEKFHMSTLRLPIKDQERLVRIALDLGVVHGRYVSNNKAVAHLVRTYEFQTRVKSPSKKKASARRAATT